MAEPDGRQFPGKRIYRLQYERCVRSVQNASSDGAALLSGDLRIGKRGSDVYVRGQPASQHTSACFVRSIRGAADREERPRALNRLGLCALVLDPAMGGRLVGCRQAYRTRLL